MRFALAKTGIATGLLLAARLALADDGSGADSEGGGAPGAKVKDAAAFVDGPSIACEGGLCETQGGTTCAVAGTWPGRLSPSPDSGLGILGVLGVLTVGGILRRSENCRPTGALRPSEPRFLG